MNKLGVPSQDGKITLYTKEECNLLGGNWHSNGECLKKEGGSFSWDNRPLKENKQAITVKVHLSDSTVEYTNVKLVTVTDLSGNLIYQNTQ